MPTTRKVVKRSAARKPTRTGRKTVGGKKAKIVRKATTKKSTTVKKTTVRKTKGKKRGHSGAGKYIGKYLKKVWAEAKAKGRKPTNAEFSKAFKDGRAEFLKSGK